MGSGSGRGWLDWGGAWMWAWSGHLLAGQAGVGGALCVVGANCQFVGMALACGRDHVCVGVACRSCGCGLSG